MLKWDTPSGYARLRTSAWDGRDTIGHDATPADLIACLKANPEALTAEQWAEVLSALPAKIQDGITERLLDEDARWGTGAVSHRNAGLKARAEKAERALADAIAERDAYKRAKAENDERFMIERDTARRERDEARAALADAIRSRIAKLEAAVTAVSEWREMGAYLPPFVVRALDEQDSGGSGAPRDAHANGDESPRASDAERGPGSGCGHLLAGSKPAASDAAGSSKTKGGDATVPGASGSLRPGEVAGAADSTSAEAPKPEPAGSSQDTATIVDRLVAANTGAVRRYVTRAEVAEMVAEACERAKDRWTADSDDVQLSCLAAELRKGAR